MQQFPAERQQSPAAAVCKKAGEANANKPARQHMQQETAEEFLGRNRHQPLLAFARVIFPAEGHFAVCKIDDPMVGYGDAMRVTSQILQDVFRSSERAFGVNDPVLAI